MMTITEINARIEAIKNNPFYQSAEMVDRLHGTEKEEYYKMRNELFSLYNERYMLTPAYRRAQIEEAERKIAFYEDERHHWAEECMQMIRDNIAECRAIIAHHKAKLAEC